jgi:hyperosmotically inducible protein
MMSLRLALIVTAVAVQVATAAPSDARTVGQFIDDTAITTEVKAKLTAERLSNLAKIEVKTDDGIVTLNGTVDSADRAIRAAQIAGAVNGVRGVVNNLHVAGSTVGPTTTSVPTPLPSPSTAIPAGTIDATGVVAQVDPASGTITLQDGRVLQSTAGTVIWQPGTIQSIRPGSQVFVRGAAPSGVQRGTNTTPADLRMGTVRSVDRAGYQIVLTDGTLVRVAPSANVHRGPDRIPLEQLVPGTEVVIRTIPPGAGSAEGSALPGPGRTATGPFIEASDVNVVWMPSAAGLR